MKTQRGVSDEARAEVERRSGKFCELFHEIPTPGNQIVHTIHHQGLGGAASDAECNDPYVLLWGCQECHDRLHGPGMPYKVARVDLAVGVLEILDDQRRPIPHEQIFFHNQQWWWKAFDRYPQLRQKVLRYNLAGFALAEEIAWFAPGKGKPPLQYVCPELLQTSNGHERESLTPLEDFKRLYSHLGMTKTRGEELRKIGQWAEENKLSDIGGVDLDALDALRSLPQEEQVELLGLWERPADFWDGVDKARMGKKIKRRWVVEELDGKLREQQSVEKPELLEGEALMRGTVVVGAGRVRDERV